MEIKKHYLLDAEGVEGIRALGELLVPAQKIFADAEIKTKWNSGHNMAEVLSYALIEHAEEVLEILAIDAGEQATRDEIEHLKLAALYSWGLSLLNSSALQEVFTLQGQNGESARFGSATANTVEKEE